MLLKWCTITSEIFENDLFTSIIRNEEIYRYAVLFFSVPWI